MSEHLRTLTQLQDYLDAEFAWRLKEIADLKAAVRRSNSLSQNTVIRASVPLVYAHWEGFVKNSALGYINFVNCQGHRYEKLSTCFVVFGLKKYLHDVAESRKSKLNIETTDFLRSQLGTRAQLKMSSAIDTESNLKSPVFDNIARSIGIDTQNYETRYNFIDESLVKRRNNIAHGEYLDLGADECRDLADQVIYLLRAFKTDIENAASTTRYKQNP